jgi:alkylated DNA repair dioxygenase AlkB
MGNGIREHGFQVDELQQIATQINQQQSSTAASAEILVISDALPAEHRADNQAAVLVIRNGAQLFCPGIKDPTAKLLQEQQDIEYDHKFWNARQKKTMNKRARFNTTFGDKSIAPSDDFRTPSTHAWPPTLKAFRSGLVEVLGDRAINLNAEGNHYYEKKSGIGYHGDAERKIVICLSLGGESVLRYHWRMPGSSEHTMEGVDVHVRSGDVYVMSEKATGYDWRSRSKIRVVHGAGSDKYVGKNCRTKKKEKSSTW